MDTNKQVNKLLKKLRKEFAEWVINETTIEMFRDETPTIFKAYLDGKEKSSSLGLYADALLTWHYNQYANAVLNEERYPWDEFALCARYAKAALQFESAFAEVGQGGSVLLRKATVYFSLNVLAGGRADADTVGRLLLHGLDTSLHDLRDTGEGKFYRHFWFLLHLYSSFKSQTLDTSPYSYPEDMRPYATVLADWRTTDLAKVHQFVSLMADFHVQEARTTAHDELAEFDVEDVMLFPYEILAFLRLREWAGLTNPETFDHPLMQQPLAKLPTPVPLPQPDTPLLDHVIAKFKEEYPGSFA